MNIAKQPLADLEAVEALGADFAVAGYNAEQVPQLLGADAHHALGLGHRWAALHVTGVAACGSADSASRGTGAEPTTSPAALATIVRLFLLGTTEPADRVAAALPRLGMDRGIASGILETTNDAALGAGAIRAAVDIRPHADDTRSYLVVSDFDSDCRPGPVRADHVLGIGAASISLARAVIRRPVGRVLDIGTGCGIQALHCSSHSNVVTATDTNPRALALAAATARLNGLTWDLRPGSLFAPVEGERFDLIVSNPPFVISSGVQRFEYRDSGRAGDALCRELVAGLPDHLTPGGTAHLLANWLIRRDDDWRMVVGGWIAATGLNGWVVQREVARPAEYVSLWLQDTGEAAGSAAAAEATASEWLAYFAREGVTGIGMGTITLRRQPEFQSGISDVIFDELPGAGDILTGPEIDGFLARRAFLAGCTDRDLLGAKLSLAAGVLLEQRLVPGKGGWSPVLRRLHRPGGPGASLQLDEWGQALLAGCTGELPLGTLVELLASAHGFDIDALAAAVIPAVRIAITRGLLHPTEIS